MVKNVASVSLSCLVLFYFCRAPESPRWLLSKLRTVDALDALIRGRKTNQVLTPRDRNTASDLPTRLHEQYFKSNKWIRMVQYTQGNHRPFESCSLNGSSQDDRQETLCYPSRYFSNFPLFLSDWYCSREWFVSQPMWSLCWHRHPPYLVLQSLLGV